MLVLMRGLVVSVMYVWNIRLMMDNRSDWCLWQGVRIFDGLARRVLNRLLNLNMSSSARCVMCGFIWLCSVLLRWLNVVLNTGLSCRNGCLGFDRLLSWCLMLIRISRFHGNLWLLRSVGVLRSLQNWLSILRMSSVL